MQRGAFYRFFHWFNSQNTFLIIYILILANFIGKGLMGGEEQYLAFAKQFMNPKWMPGSFSLNHPPGDKIIFQVIFGFLLRFFSFEQVTFWGRMVNFLLLAIPLSLFFKKLRFKNIEILLILQVGYFMHQSIWAGEWIFRSIEQKTFAYIFVFLAFYNILSDRTYRAIIYLSLGTYFHFLVGGWMAFFLVIYVLIYRKSFFESLKHGFLFLAITLPFIIFLYTQYFNGQPSVINGININWVYSIYRHPHHMGMFADIPYFMAYHLGGVLISLGFLLLCIFGFRKLNDSDIKKINTLNIIIFSQQFVFIAIALFDKNGVLLKSYPFRTSALSAFLIIVEICLVVKRYGLKHIYKLLTGNIHLFSTKSWVQKRISFYVFMNIILVTLFLPRFILETKSTIQNFYIGEDKVDKSTLELYEYIKVNTSPSSVFLFMDKLNPYSFTRRTDREQFVIGKFTPTYNKTIYEWYTRLMLIEDMRKDISNIEELVKNYKVDYLISDSLLTNNHLEMERQFGSKNLYRVIY
jgi:hypothetical protein